MACSCPGGTGEDGMKRSACMLLAMTAAGVTGAAEPPYPVRPVRIVVPFAPGGSTDIVARILAQRLSESLGQPVVVENRGGGGTVIGTDTVAKATPDGYTLLQCTVTMAINVGLGIKQPYDAQRDFAPITLVSRQSHVLIVHPGVPAKSVAELVQLAKAKPGSLNFSSPGNHSGGHLAGELFKSLAGIRIVHVPYKGTGPALTDLMGGQVQMFIYTTTGSVPYVKGGKVKALAVSGETRLAALPDVPTFTEAGLPGYDVKTWQGVLAPAATPRAAVDKLSQEIGHILGMPDVKEKLLGLGTDPFISTPAQFGELIRTDMVKFARVIKAANMKLE